jgi:hypothetical protein
MHIGSSVDSAAIARIQEGMRVIDAAGDEIGKVKYVQMGDSEAVTTAGNEQRPTDLLGRIASDTGLDDSEPDVPSPLRTSLRRTGYVKISGHGLTDPDRYASSDQVGDVSGDTVRLTVSRADLATKS